MVIAGESRGTSVTLRFYGGFFRPAPGLGEPVGMDVQFRDPEAVRVTEAEEGSSVASILTRAERIDVVSEGEERLRLPEPPWARSISHVLPIDPRGFRKTVAFRGGTLSGRVDPVRLEAERERLLGGEADGAFHRLTGLSDPEDPYVRRLQDAFRRQVAGGEGLAPWIEGYAVDVVLRARWIVVNGEAEESRDGIGNGRDSRLMLPPGAVLEFGAAEGSHLPHYPADNPHVLEQPPTI